MKFVYPNINHVVEITEDQVNTLVIENQKLFAEILQDLCCQLQGDDGRSVLSNNEKILDISKNLELLSQFVPFEINKKSLISRVISLMEKQSVDADHYEETMEELSRLEAYMYHLAFDMTGDLTFTKISPASLIKAVGIEFEDNYDSLAEKLIDYMELVTFYDRPKLFVFVNLRSYISDAEAEAFFETVLSHQFKVVLIENKEYNRIALEKRYIVDEDLCEIF